MLLFASENCPMVPEEPCLRLSGRCGTDQETSLYMVAVERGCESVQADSSCKCYSPLPPVCYTLSQGARSGLGSPSLQTSRDSKRDGGVVLIRTSHKGIKERKNDTFLLGRRFLSF